MIVTFVSQCEKNALNKTRRVLDAFADRIGDRTWQTIITMEGVLAVKKLLKKTASKNTAVSCHWQRGRSRTELLWVVGNRRRFNYRGLVPVNYTRNTVINTQWENDWHDLSIIKCLAALAALFHDWGKASVCFQEKLQPKNAKRNIADPLRHEWISTLLLYTFINAQRDEEWLTQLANGDFNSDALIELPARNPSPALDQLPPIGQLVAWLVLTHHKLPTPRHNSDELNRWKGESADSIEAILKRVQQDWGYGNPSDDSDYERRLRNCFTFSAGLPHQSPSWLKQTKKWARKSLDQLPRMNAGLSENRWRLWLHHARLSLMLGDHNYSSQPADSNWQPHLTLYANTDPKTNRQKQFLDEHLVGVAKQALHTAHQLPMFEKELPYASDLKPLQRKSPPAFRWQDKAVKKIKDWRATLPESQKDQAFGFFAVNMASTGCGKTFANAKVMRALSQDGDSLRYALALGLRTLTLQTGDEYRERIKLDPSELAVVIGSKTVQELHQRRQANQKETFTSEEWGSESIEELLDEEVDFEGLPNEDNFSTVLKQPRDRKFLYAPVLVCTIDHLMAATETQRGGRYILPSLRLMSSDLVIDEIDDFDGLDLIAIGRLIHLAGMLGRKVMISSATIPPDLAQGYFNAYRQGWLQYSQGRDASKNIGCAWIDEFTTQVESVSYHPHNAVTDYQSFHDKFISKRTQSLKTEPIRRKAEIIACEAAEQQNEKESLEQDYFQRIQATIVTQHNRHRVTDPITEKQVSFGVVRMANIPPCVNLARYLFNTDWPEGHEVRIMAYHSRQVMLLRSEQEQHLDHILKRKAGQDAHSNTFSDPIIRHHLDHCAQPNLMFIVVASPVEEVGRDHDFDWAIVEPSSYRSIIQMAGRVLRHRQHEPQTPNVALMQYNLKALTYPKGKAVFCRPGYEGNGHDPAHPLMSNHDLKAIIDEKAIAKRLDAQPRIRKPKQLRPQDRLVDLEHHSIANLVNNSHSPGPDSLNGWLTQCWWLTALPQRLTPFRAGPASIKLFLVWDEENLYFTEKDDRGQPLPVESVESIYRIHKQESPLIHPERLWLQRRYTERIEQLADELGVSPKQASLRFGEVALDYYETTNSYEYSDQLGLTKRPPHSNKH